MKKGLVLTILIGLILISTVVLVGAKTCDELGTQVCASTPNSAVGYGAVDICNNCHPCGVADGVCPEDFYSTVTSTRGSCRNCPDLDCSTTVSGHVTTLEGNPVPGAEIYVTHSNGQYVIATTDENGYYTSITATAGLVRMHASYSDYDTEIISTELFRSVVNDDVDIVITPGACNDDCTDAFGAVCKAKCNGFNECVFTNATIYDNAYSSEYVADRCDGFAPGTRFSVFTNSTDIVYAQCCSLGTTIEPRPQLEPVEDGSNECIDNLGTHVIKTKYKGQAVRVVVKSWQSSCD